jgi:hypothetical protein
VRLRRPLNSWESNPLRRPSSGEPRHGNRNVNRSAEKSERLANANSSAAGDSSRTYTTQRLGRDRQLQHSLGGAARKEQNYSSPQRGKRESRHGWSHDQRRDSKAKGDALPATVCAEHQRIELKKETGPNHMRNICVHLTP